MAGCKLKARQQAKQAAKRPLFRITKRQSVEIRLPKVQKHVNALLKIDSKDKRDNIARRNAQQSPLLRIPLDIRNKIYNYVLGGKEFSVYIPKDKPVCTIEEGERKTHRELLSVCTQTYSETATLPFIFSKFYVWPHLVKKWLATLLPAQRDAITTLRVNFPEVKNGSLYLRNFSGLSYVEVCWTPDHCEELEDIAEQMREDANKPYMKVVFLHDD